MYPAQSNYNRKSLSQKRNRDDPSDVPLKNSRLQSRQVAKLELELKMKLEMILNNNSVKNDYFTIYSSDLAADSNSSFSTIGANRSRSTDCYCSDTDATRSDDIVIHLDEDAFYSTKVNPFPQVKFPVKTMDETNETKNIINTKDVIGDRFEKDVPPAVENTAAVNATSKTGKSEENYIADTESVSIPPEGPEVITEEIVLKSQSAGNVIDSAHGDAAIVAEKENTPEQIVKITSFESQSAGKIFNSILCNAVSAAEKENTTDQKEDEKVMVKVIIVKSQSAGKIIDSILGDVSIAESQATPTVDNQPAPIIIDEAAKPDPIIENIPPEVNTTDEVVNAEDNSFANNIPPDVTEQKEEEKVLVAVTSCDSQSAGNVINPVLDAAVIEADTENAAGNTPSPVTAPDLEILEDVPSEKDTVPANESPKSQSMDKVDLAENEMEKENSVTAAVLEDDPSEKNNTAANDPPQTEPTDKDKEVENEMKKENSVTAVIFDTAPNVVVLEDDPAEKDNVVANDPPRSQTADKVEVVKNEMGKERDDSTSCNPPAVVSTTEDIPTKTMPILTAGQENRNSALNCNRNFRGNEQKNEVAHWLKRSNTHIASKTKVKITTDDCSVIDTFEDLPEFINTSISELTSSFISERILKEASNQTIYCDSSSSSSSSSTSTTKLMQSSSSLSTPSLSSSYSSSSYSLSSSQPYNYISSCEAFMRLNKLLQHGTIENRKAVGYDEYNKIRADDEIASSEEEFLTDLDDLDLTGWKPPESELRRQVRIILTKLNPLEYDYKATVNNILYKYLMYINDERRISKVNGIMECVQQPLSLIEKTELLIKREINDKKLNNRFYYSPDEPPSFSEFCARRREAIIRKYDKCRKDRFFCHNYFKRSIEHYNRPISKLEQKIDELKRQFDLIFS